jgi:hypothetical protein
MSYFANLSRFFNIRIHVCFQQIEFRKDPVWDGLIADRNLLVVELMYDFSNKKS